MRLITASLFMFAAFSIGWHYGEQNGLQQGADGNFQCKIEVME